MQINRFVAEKVHGFLQFDVAFDAHLTFMIGINGSGKTTVLNCIAALIAPDVRVLATVDYKKIFVEIEHDGKKHKIQAEKTKGAIRLHCSGLDEDFTFAQFVPDPDADTYVTATQSERDYYAQLLTINSQNKVLKFISDLPSPMFLGLDRRPQLSGTQFRARRVRMRSLARNVFSPVLSDSLIDAATLAEIKVRDALIDLGTKSDASRTQMVLELLTVEPAAVGHPLSLPKRSEVQEIGRLRQQLEGLPQILSVPPEEVRNRLIPFLNTLEEYASKIRDAKSVEDMLKKPSPATNALIAWNFNKTQVARVRKLSDMVRVFNEQRADITRFADQFTGLINRFVGDSGKIIRFDDRGYISFTIDGVEGDRQITSLSSGEAQIFVILSYLFFHPASQVANSFIIDEPELSLHVQWQELFVSSIQEANPNVQYILATHSPSIILEKTANCVDISRERRK